MIRFGTGIIRSSPNPIAIARVNRNEKEFIYPFGYIQRPKFVYSIIQPFQINSHLDNLIRDDSPKIFCFTKSHWQLTTDIFSTEIIKNNTKVQYLLINIKLAKLLFLREI